MEKFKDVANNLRDRFTNPLIFSFICSWLIFNWRITLAIFGYDQSHIINEGYRSVYSFIACNLHGWNAFLYPFLSACAYTFLNPIVRNYIRVYYSGLNAKGETNSLKAAEGNFIPIEKYIKLRNATDRQEKTLVKIINQEEKTSVKNIELETSNRELEIKVKEFEGINFNLEDRLKQLRNYEILNGTWTLTYRFPNEKTQKQEIEINNGNLSLIDEFNQKSFRAKIENFYYDSYAKTIFFIKKIDDPNIDTRPFLINNLQFEDMNRLYGKENTDIDVEYTRRSYTLKAETGIFKIT